MAWPPHQSEFRRSQCKKSPYYPICARLLGGTNPAVLTPPFSYLTTGCVKTAMRVGRYLGQEIVSACRKMTPICNSLWISGRRFHLNSGSRFSNWPGGWLIGLDGNCTMQFGSRTRWGRAAGGRGWRSTQISKVSCSPGRRFPTKVKHRACVGPLLESGKARS